MEISLCDKRQEYNRRQCDPVNQENELNMKILENTEIYKWDSNSSHKCKENFRLIKCVSYDVS